MKKKIGIIAILIISLAIFSRFFLLGLRPIHHDEGMLSYFAWQLAEGKGYIYTPQIHGPILFYLQAAIFKFFGTGDSAARTSMALFGIILTGLPLALYKKLGIKRAITISILILTSPLLTYFSRFLVHTGLVVVPNFILIIMLWLFIKNFRPIYLYLIAISLALAFGISETSYIFVASILLFVPFYLLFDRNEFSKLWERLKQFIKNNYLDVISSFLLFVLIWIVIYSVGLTSPKSFFLSLPNPFNPDSGLGFWLAQHEKKLGGQPWFYYLLLFVVYEPILLVSGILAAFKSFVARHGGKLQLFTVFLAFVNLIGYSIAGEKFPWLFLPTLVLFAIAGGLYLGGNKFKPIYLIIWIILGLFTIFNNYRLNYTNPADTRELATYVQTPNSFRAIADKVRNDCFGKSSDCVVIDSEISWPLSWEFKNISQLDFLNDLGGIKPDTKYVFASADRANILEGLDYPLSRIQLRDWWVPPVCRKIDCTQKYIGYFLSRKIWGSRGGYEILMLERK